jgi:uncharacterized protein YndB with AHSA1/START domain
MRLMIAALLVALSAPAAGAELVSAVRHQEADGSHSLAHMVVVDAPVAEVWAAISTAIGWRSWAVPVAWTLEGTPDILETSYTPTARPGDPSTIRQQLLASIPPRLMVFRTIKAPAGFPDFATFSKVSSVFELEAVGPARTRVRLTGAGYADTDAGRRLLGLFEQGNRISLESLRNRFIDGPLDWPSKLSRMSKAQTKGD